MAWAAKGERRGGGKRDSRRRGDVRKAGSLPAGRGEEHKRTVRTVNGTRRAMYKGCGDPGIVI